MQKLNDPCKFVLSVKSLHESMTCAQQKGEGKAFCLTSGGLEMLADAAWLLKEAVQEKWVALLP